MLAGRGVSLRGHSSVSSVASSGLGKRPRLSVSLGLVFRLSSGSSDDRVVCNRFVARTGFRTSFGFNGITLVRSAERRGTASTKH